MSHLLIRASISLSIPLLFFSLNSQAQITEICGRAGQIEAIILEKLYLLESDCGSEPTESLARINEINGRNRKISRLSAETTVPATPQSPATNSDYRLSPTTELMIVAGSTASTGNVWITVVNTDRDEPDKTLMVTGGGYVEVTRLGE
ncbi:MAG: hypothetical protein F4065_00620 [Rhodothermaceae bacterium]|nr:hypothetical protein [Rhodothermaceae bacterium]MXZ58614.1 hypothetical protein [Rhodothermaceae bacterium]MYB91023.1 hypothetical protein [Rhodothermaceae bacterium]MYD66927.1 hypothetical protein [Rhodothermaceae bacterium]MYG44818.1 hypothetical protein [Rhodothermaceae bacterium]